ncbi:MAG: O-antigen polymerase [Candidatus Delongbacteria bacterium]
MPDHFYYILISILIFSVFFSWLKSGNIINPLTLFVLWWGTFIFVSSLNLIGMNIPSMHTYYLIFLSMSMYAAGSITFLPYQNRMRKDITAQKSKYTLPLKLKIFLILQFALTVFLISYSGKALSMLRTMDPGTFRALVFTDEGIFGANKKYFTFIISPSLYISCFIITSGVFIKKIPKYFLVLSFINLMLYSSITAGRAPIFIATITLLLGFLYNLNFKKIDLKLRYILMIAVPLIFVVWMSVFRKSFTAGSKSIYDIFLEYFIWYFTGPFTAFDYFLHNMKGGINYDHSVIRGVFAGLEDLFDPLLEKLFPGFTQINESFHSFTRTFRSLGGAASRHNSHYTMLYTFVRDAGTYGVVIFSYLFGAVVASVYRCYIKRQTLTNFSVLLILTYLSIIGTMRWELRYIWSWASILGILFLTKKVVVEKNGTSPGIRN